MKITNRFDALNQKFDANETVILKEKLTHVMTRVHEKIYPQFKARLLFPVNNEGGAGLTSIVYPNLDYTGNARIVGSKANDSKRADVKGGFDEYSVRTLESSFGYTVIDLERATRAGFALSDKKALAARRAIEASVDEIALLGDKYFNLKGLLTDTTALNEYTLTSDGTGSAMTFSSKTGLKMYNDLLGLINKASDGTSGEIDSNTLVLPPSQYGLITTTPISTDNPQLTVARNILETTSITSIVKWARLKGVTSPDGVISNKDVICAFNRDSEYIELNIPREFQMLAMQLKDIEYSSTCLLDIAGLAIHQPKTIAFAKGA